MQSGIWKHVALAALMALGLYAAAYWAIEHRRTRNGPWQLTFSMGERGEPIVQADQPQLGVRGMQLVFERHPTTTDVQRQRIVVQQPQPTPFDLPFGRCIYLDLTFLPGVVTCDFFGHEVEFMPRTLVVDKHEIPWKPNQTVRISGSGTNRTFQIQHSNQDGP
jgi:hypothetical protein